MGKYSASKNFNHGYPTPGPQTPTSQDVMDHVFFASKTEWKDIRENQEFDFIVIGTGFCSLAFIDKTLENNPHAKILVLERGPFFLPEHFQNLPLPYRDTLGGMSETFPWSITKETNDGEFIKWQAGMVPFFGGRSTLWSGWCPRPTRLEMINWPKSLIDAAEKYFTSAEKLLNVVNADEIESTNQKKPIYGTLQKELQDLLIKNTKKVSGLTRVIPAPLAVKEPMIGDIDFAKFSTPGKLLEVLDKQLQLSRTFQDGQDHIDCDSKKLKKGSKLQIVTNCNVEKIINEKGHAIALKTSRGIVNIGYAKVILAMGTLPPTTLLHNSFPELKTIGKRFTSHFISSIYARVPKADFKFTNKLAELELGAFYVAGVDKERDHKGQFHIQLTALSDKNPAKNTKTALMNMPDVVATASSDQLKNSEDYVVFVCASLGEIDFKNSKNYFVKNDDEDITVNATLQVVANKNDNKVWDSMDASTFKTLEQILSPKGKQAVEYWDANTNSWSKKRPKKENRRAPLLVHEASTLCITNDDAGVVNLDYRPKGVTNVYVTGAGLWPTGASWNPTLTMVALSQHLADNLSKKAHVLPSKKGTLT